MKVTHTGSTRITKSCLALKEPELSGHVGHDTRDRSRDLSSPKRGTSRALAPPSPSPRLGPGNTWLPVNGEEGPLMGPTEGTLLMRFVVCVLMI